MSGKTQKSLYSKRITYKPHCGKSGVHNRKLKPGASILGRRLFPVSFSYGETMTDKKPVDKIQVSETFPGGEFVLHNGYDFPARDKETKQPTGELVHMEPAIKLYVTVQGKTSSVDFTKVDPKALLEAYTKLITNKRAKPLLEEIANTR